MSTETTKTPEESLAIVSSTRAVETAPRLRQLTGLDLNSDQDSPASDELCAPSAPWVTSDGRIRLYGTGDHFIEYASWRHFLSGDGAVPVPLVLLGPEGTPIVGLNAMSGVSVRSWHNENVRKNATWLYAGVMLPSGQRKVAHWPHDQWSRRVYAFRTDEQGRWIRQKRPLFGTIPTSGWLGHGHGHHFIDDESGSTWVFYERVVIEQRNSVGHLVPFQTEIFARRMVAPFRADDREIKILDAGVPPYPSAHRQEPGTSAHNGSLVEGARPFKATIQGESFYLMGFSSGDFATDAYGINLAWSRHLLGPYVPLLDASAQGLDFLDLGAELRERYGLSWGPARPCFFQDPQKKWWVLFHAVKKAARPHVDYRAWPKEPLERFHRNLYLAQVAMTLTEAGTPQLRILDGDPL